MVEEENYKSAKKQKNSQQFLEKYSKEWTCLQSSTKKGYAYCMHCKTDFSVMHGGRDDCRRHIDSNRHAMSLKQSVTSQSLFSFFPKNDDDYDVIRSECLFTSFLIEHNIPISVADHAGPLFAKMFPDSKIAKKYGCGRTKTGSIVVNNDKRDVINALQNNVFALATDASNDIESKKLYPLVVSFFDDSRGAIHTTLLSLLESSNNTGEGIFNLINDEFNKLDISWKKCVAFSCDNASVMIGQFKGVAAFMTKEQPNLKIIGCSCHLIHIAAQKATKMLKVDVEHFVTQIFYYLQKSSKRKHKFAECQVLCGEDLHKILKYVSTRWLSLERVLNRVLEQWSPLMKYFLDTVEPEDINAQCLDVQSFLKSPKTKLNCLFLSNAIKVFTKANVLLQKEQPSVHILRSELEHLYSNLLSRFVKPTSITKADSVYTVHFSKRKYQKEDEDLVIGSETRIYLKESELTNKERSNFYESVREFFVTACQYILKKMPLHDEFLKHAAVADIKLRVTASFKSVLYFSELFSLELDGDKLEEEFSLYQSDNLSAEIIQCERLDSAWHKISKMTVNGVYKYQTLAKLMLAILVVPHSNSPTERIFSLVKKNQTEFRSSLGLKTLEAILIEKLTVDCCYTKVFSSEELKAAKKACYKELNAE